MTAAMDTPNDTPDGAPNDAPPAAPVILVVDDVLINREIITVQLQQRGYVTRVARSGEEAVEMAAAAHPDLILLDVLMPGIDGFETCRRLKAGDATCEIPVVFMTALTATDDKIEGFRAGAVDYVTKPINADEVATRVETHLKLDAMRRRQARQNRQLREEIAEHEREMRVKREEAREDERRHIARELHDEMGQHLSAIRLELSFMRMRWGMDNPELQDKVQLVQRSIDGLIYLVRDLVSRLRPVVLDLGIEPALEWLVCEFRAASSVRCDLHIDSSGIDGLTARQTSTVFRLVQESLTNVSRHAGASHVQVSLRRQGDGCALTVRDDGVGFDPAAIGLKSLGIQGMRERASMLGGQLELRTRPGAGTTLAVAFPLDASPGAAQAPAPADRH